MKFAILSVVIVLPTLQCSYTYANISTSHYIRACNVVPESCRNSHLDLKSTSLVGFSLLRWKSMFRNVILQVKKLKYIFPLAILTKNITFLRTSENWHTLFTLLRRSGTAHGTVRTQIAAKSGNIYWRITACDENMTHSLTLKINNKNMEQYNINLILISMYYNGQFFFVINKSTEKCVRRCWIGRKKGRLHNLYKLYVRTYALDINKNIMPICSALAHIPA